MKHIIVFILLGIIVLSCQPPAPKEKELSVKHNYIVLLDLSDRLIVQENQPERDKKIIMSIYNLFAEKVRKELYIKARDEIKVVIAPQKGDKLKTEIFEDKLYIDVENIPLMLRRKTIEKQNTDFGKNIDTLYQKAEFSSKPSDYHGADIWKYVYEDLKTDFIKDTMTENFLFILTDGYPIVGKNKEKLNPVKESFPNLHVVIVEAAPREEDMEWDNIMNLWAEWFKEIGITNYTLIKRKAISKEIEEIKNLIGE